MAERFVIDNFLGGLAPSRHYGNPNGQYDTGTSGSPTSVGWTPFRIDEEGLLQRGLPETTITNVSLFQGDVKWFKQISKKTGTFAYCIGEDDNSVINKLHQINVATNTVTNSTLFPHDLSTYTNGGTGLEFYNGYLYYASGRYLGRYNMSLTFDNSFNIYLGTTALGYKIEHPMVQGNGKLFIGNSNYSLNTACIATVSDELVNLCALDLGKTEQVIKAIRFNGKFLYIATSGNAGGTAYVSDNYLYVWDTVSSSWQEQYKFPDEDFTALEMAGNTLYCWGRKGFYQFNGSGFDIIFPSTALPPPYGVSVHPDGTVWWTDSSGSIYSYGAPNQQFNPIVIRPIKPTESAYGGVFWASRSKLFVGGFTSGNRLRSYQTIGTGDYNTAEWRTPMINFGKKTRFLRVYLSFMALDSGVEFNVQWIDGLGTGTPTTLGTVTTAGLTEADFSYDGLVSDKWQIIINHTKGTGGKTPKFKRIAIEYEEDKE